MQIDRIIEKLKKRKPEKGTEKINNDRALVLKDFLDRLNIDRKPPYKPLQAPRLAKMMMYMSTSEMKAYYATCCEAKNFSKYFWWGFKK